MPELTLNRLQTLPLSPSSLAQLDKCARLFRFLYLDRLLWPAGETFDLEVDARRGQIFHRLVELHSKGHQVNPLLASVEPGIRQWWQTFLQSGHVAPQGRILAEIPLWITVNGFKLTARLDRLLIHKGQFHIFDWKTERKRPPDSVLCQSWQVRLYPLMVAQAGALFNHGDPIVPEAVRMTIWYANHPDQPFSLTYNQTQSDLAQQHLEQTLARLQEAHAQNYPLTSNRHLCSSCGFRTRCYGLSPEGADPEQLGLFTGLVESSMSAEPDPSLP